VDLACHGRLVSRRACGLPSCGRSCRRTPHHCDGQYCRNQAGPHLCRFQHRERITLARMLTSDVLFAGRQLLQRCRQQIAEVERRLARSCVQTPYVRLLAMSRVNVVFTANFLGEMCPVTSYANANGMTGRSGLYLAHDHEERNHQGIGDKILEPRAPTARLRVGRGSAACCGTAIARQRSGATTTRGTATGRGLIGQSFPPAVWRPCRSAPPGRT
jgi:hypothetical protein